MADNEKQNSVPTEGDLRRGIEHPEVRKIDLYKEIEARKKQIEQMPEGPIKKAMKKGLEAWITEIHNK